MPPSLLTCHILRFPPFPRELPTFSSVFYPMNSPAFSRLFPEEVITKCLCNLPFTNSLLLHFISIPRRQASFYCVFFLVNLRTLSCRDPEVLITFLCNVPYTIVIFYIFYYFLVDRKCHFFFLLTHHQTFSSVI